MRIDGQRYQQLYMMLEQRFMLSMRQCGITAWIYDLDRHSIRRVEGPANVFGNLQVQDHVPQSLLPYVYPDDQEKLTRLYGDLHAGKKAVDTVLRWRVYGEWRWIHINYTLVTNAAGTARRAFGTGVDVTEQKETERRFSDELTRNAAMEGETLSHSFSDLTEERMLSWLIDGLADKGNGLPYALGLQMLSQSIPDAEEHRIFLSRFAAAELRAAYERGEKKITYVHRHRHSDGRWLWVRTTVNVTSHAETGHLVSYAYTRDVDAEVVGRMALESALDNEVDVVACLQVSSGITRVIKAQPGRVLKTGDMGTYEDIVSRVLPRILEEERAAYQRQFSLPEIYRQLAESGAYTILFRAKNRLGELRRKRMNIRYLDETRQQVLFVRSDITAVYQEEQRQRRQLTRALKEAEQANLAKSEFLSHMSHEIRTPMNAIIGLATLIAGRAGDEAYVRENIAKVDMSAHFLLALINDILDISRIESGHMELTEEATLFADFLSTIDTMIRTRAEEKAVRYERRLGDGLADWYCFDALKLKQVLINVLSNAVKFTSANGEVIFTVEKAGAEGKNDWLRFTICDTGIGIDAAFLPRLFDAFAQEYGGSTTLYGGTGLGLAISRSIVRLMQGDIRVKSEKGKGTVFVIEVPLRPLPAASLPVSSKVQEAAFDFRGRRLLLAEDNEINREVAEGILREVGFALESASDGQLALSAYLSHPAGYYDAILMDVRMPVMDGLTATRRIRGSGKEDAATVPILAMTANAFEEDIKKSLAAGMDAHLAKPIEPEILYRRLRQYIK